MPDELVTDPTVQAAGKALGDAGGVLTEAADALEAAIASGDTGELIVALAGLVEASHRAVRRDRKVVAAIGTRTAAITDADARAAVEDLFEVLARRIADYLLISTIEIYRPRFTFLLKLLGLIDWTVVEEDPANASSRRHVRKALRLDRLQDLISDPVGHFTTVLGWGAPDFDPLELFRTAASFYGREVAIDGGVVAGDAFVTKGPFTWSRDSSTSPPGLRLDVDAEVKQGVEGRVGINAVWGSTLAGSVTASGGLAAILTPPFRIEVEPKAAEVTGKVSAFVNRNEEARPFTIIGGNDLVQLTADDVSVGAELEVGASTAAAVEVQPRIFSDIKGLTLTLGQEGADSFLASLLADLDITGRFDLGLEWRGDEGLVVKAAGGLEIAIPMHQSLGVVEFETVYVALRIGDDGTLTLELSAAMTGSLGPLAVAVDRIGASSTCRSPAATATPTSRFGPLDLALGFKPPNGVGLSLDAGVRQGRRLPLHRRRARRVRRRARARLRRLPHAQGDRPDHDADAGRLARASRC